MSPMRQALALVRAHVDQHFGHICTALSFVAVGHPHLQEECETLRTRIMTELGQDDCCTMAGYLDTYDLPWDRNTRNLARLAWIDKLLTEQP